MAQNSNLTEDLLHYIKCNFADCAAYSDVTLLIPTAMLLLLDFMKTHLEIDLKGAIVRLVKRWAAARKFPDEEEEEEQEIYICSSRDESLCIDDEVFEAMGIEHFPSKVLMELQLDQNLHLNEMQQRVLDDLCGNLV
jgi:hypothetical protein